MSKLFLSIILFLTFENNNFTGYFKKEANTTRQKLYQYMSVCTDGHGVLSPWMDTQDEANKYGKDHEVLTKGHRWRIDTREKPKKDSTNTMSEFEEDYFKNRIKRIVPLQLNSKDDIVPRSISIKVGKQVVGIKPNSIVVVKNDKLIIWELK